MSPLSIWETGRGLHRSYEMSLERADAIVRDFVRGNDVVTVAIDDEIGSEAIRASGLFGKGRYPAALDMADCFAYACAKTLGVPLLAMGDDFPRTDIEMA